MKTITTTIAAALMLALSLVACGQTSTPEPSATSVATEPDASAAGIVATETEVPATSIAETTTTTLPVVSTTAPPTTAQTTTTTTATTTTTIPPTTTTIDFLDGRIEAGEYCLQFLDEHSTSAKAEAGVLDCMQAFCQASQQCGNVSRDDWEGLALYATLCEAYRTYTNYGYNMYSDFPINILSFEKRIELETICNDTSVLLGWFVHAEDL